MAVELQMPMPHAGQQALLKSEKRFNWAVCGRRWFKTSLGEQIGIVHALKGERIIWGAPTYDQVRIAFDQINRMAYKVVNANQSRMEMKFASGGSILFRSFDNPDNARGHTANGVIMDEAADLHPDSWNKVLRPMLITTKGWSWGFGTPKGGNWLFKEYSDALGINSSNSAAFRAPTLGYRIDADGLLIRDPHPLENATIDPSEIESMWRSMPERSFRQEILAEFTEDAGGVFRSVRAISTLQPQQPIAGHAYVAGLDFGRSNDFTCLTIIDVSTMQEVAIDRFNAVSWEMQRDRIKILAERYNVMLIIAEENAIGGPNIEALVNDNLPIYPFTTTQQSKDAIISGLSLAIERRSIGLLNDDVQIGELEAFELARLPGGGYKYSAPEGQHDDTVMALALALYGCQRAGFSGISFVDCPVSRPSSPTEDLRSDVRRHLLGGAE